MACSYEETPEDKDRSLRSREKLQRIRDNELNKVTRMLCSLCKAITETGTSMIAHLDISPKDSEEINAWYINHQAMDQQRLAIAKENGLAKLTDEEKEALGL